ncbi:helicase-related protein [Bacillus cereus]
MKINEIMDSLGEKENIQEPYMIRGHVPGKLQQEVLCFGLATDNSDGQNQSLLWTIIAGADSSIQAIKTIIDGGYGKVSFGKRVKQGEGFFYQELLGIRTKKGEYKTNSINIGNKKALIIYHDKLHNQEYLISFENPANSVCEMLKNNYGSPLLEEWYEDVYKEVIERGYMKTSPIYYDKNIFQKPVTFLEKNELMSEEAIDELISLMVKNKKIKFPVKGDGAELSTIPQDLGEYISRFSIDMLEKLSNNLSPLHNPIVDPTCPRFNEYPIELFPAQAHVATALSKFLMKNKSVLLQGKTSTGKTKMMTAVADALAYYQGKEGYRSIVYVPPSLTSKWAEKEIYSIIPGAEVHWIKKTSDLINWHNKWIKEGKPKAKKPTFFVISFTTMRSGATIEKAVSFQKIQTEKGKKNWKVPYKDGWYCPSCMQAHQVIEDKEEYLDSNGILKVKQRKRPMLYNEFGTARRVDQTQKLNNAYCSECGESLWTNKVLTRFASFKDWTTYEKKLLKAIQNGEKYPQRCLQEGKSEMKKSNKYPRRVAAIEYIHRKMKNVFDIAIIDEVHELKSGATAQGFALSKLVASVKHTIAGTATLFGGKAQDIYFLLWRLFPSVMHKAGYKYNELQRWNKEYGNIEKIVYNAEEEVTEYSNKQSKGGRQRVTEKVMPGISPYVLQYLIPNGVWLNLFDVWPEELRVPFIDVPTIFCDMDSNLKEMYEDMSSNFDRLVLENQGAREDRIPNIYTLYTETGISALDNPFRYPLVTGKRMNGEIIDIWQPNYEQFSSEKLLPKEAKLVERLESELSEERVSLVYVKDTGTTKEERDIQPRLKEVIEKEIPNAKVAILRTTSCKTDRRTEWIEKKVSEGYNVIITSIKLVKVGVDLLITPTIMFYQYCWSMFDMIQAKNRAFRIGQTQECRVFYFAYKGTFQEYMALIIAKKNKASQAIGGEVTSDGLSAMLGDDGDIQKMLIESIQSDDGLSKLRGSAEEWTRQSNKRVVELLSKKIKTIKLPNEQLLEWLKERNTDIQVLNRIEVNQQKIMMDIQKGNIKGFSIQENNCLAIDDITAFGFPTYSDADIYQHLMCVKANVGPLSKIKIVEEKMNQKGKRKSKIIDGQLALVLDF